MQYCEGYLRLSSIKWNQFNGFLFGLCDSKWCTLYSLKGFANHSTVHIKRKNKEGKLDFKLAQKFSSLSF